MILSVVEPAMRAMGRNVLRILQGPCEDATVPVALT